MSWDGYRAPPPNPSRAALGKWLAASLAVLLLVPAVLLPFRSAAADDQTLQVSGTAFPGHRLRLAGTGFPAGTRIGLAIDGSHVGMPSAETSSDGTFEAAMVVPIALTPGEHTIVAFVKDGDATGSGAAATPDPTSGVIATVGITVLDPVASLPNPSPSPIAPQASTAPNPLATATATPTPGTPTPTERQPDEATEAPSTPKPTARPTKPPATAEATEKPKPPDFAGGAIGAYGTVQGDSRNNHLVGGPARAVLDYRFRATANAAPESLRVQQRGGNGYSSGNGGQISVTIQTDDGGQPSGNVVASLTFNPDNPSGNWERHDRLSFGSAEALTRGRVYHLVFTNVAGDPVRDFISLNDLFYWGNESPRQPTFGNDFAVLYKEGQGWQVKDNDTPIFDLAYANGAHDGMAYIGSMPDYYGVISGPSNMVREHFTVSGGDRAVSSASIKVKRINGSAPLTISLLKGTTTLVSKTVPASAIALGSLPTVYDASHLGGNTWATISFQDLTLESGATYNLVLSTESGTKYIAVPVEEGGSKGLRSYRFTDGAGQVTTDGGSSWPQLYLWSDVDLQFVLE